MKLRGLRSAILMLLAVIVTPIVFTNCDSRAGDSESRGQARELRERLEDEQKRFAAVEQEVISLREENRRLQSELAAATGGAGLDVTERQRLLDDRRASLDTLEADLTERQKAVEQSEDWIQRQSQEFYERTNMTMEEIGEARHIKTEYEAMREQRDAAVAKAEGWLKFIWAVSIACGLTYSFAVSCCTGRFRCTLSSGGRQSIEEMSQNCSVNRFPLIFRANKH